MAGASIGLSLSAIAIVALVVAGSINIARRYRRLQHFKGPTLGCFSNLWVFKATILGNLNQQTSAVLKQYGEPCPIEITLYFPTPLEFWLTTINALGPFARIGPNLLVTDDVDLLRHMSAARSVYTRSDWYDGMKLDPNVNNLISERNDQRHTALRAKMAAGVGLITFVKPCSGKL